MNKLKNIKYIFLDSDQTLLDFSYAEKFAFKSAMQKLNLPSDDESYNRFSQDNIRLWKCLERGEVEKSRLMTLRFENLLKNLWIEAPSPEVINNAYLNFLSSCGKTLPGAEGLCSALTKKYKLYITTNGTAIAQSGRLKDSGLLPYIDEVFISDIIGYNKPKQEFFDYCFRKIGDYDKNRYIIFGDSLSADMAGGKNAGITTCLYDPEDKIKMPNEYCDYKVNSLAAFEKMMCNT